MKKQMRIGFVLSVALFSLVSCSKEKGSFSNFSEPTEIIAMDTPKKEVRNEILAAVYDISDMTRPGKLQIFDFQGNLVKEKLVKSGMLDFKRWEINGTYRYSYVALDLSYPKISGVGYIPGPVVILDENLNEMQQVMLLPHGDRTQPEPVDGHEFIYLDDNHFVVMAYLTKEVSNIPAHLNPATGTKVVACIIQEIKNGEVVYEWDGTDYPEFYSTSVEGNQFSTPGKVWDYLHVNSIFIDPADGNFIVSCRNTDQVIKINKATSTPLWRLGGTNSNFKLTSEQKFYRQHNATLTDDGKTLLLFDNGHGTERPYSRIVEFRLNEIVRAVTAFKAMDVPGNTFGQYMGSVQKTTNSYFIGCGSAPKIYEVDLISQKVILEKTLEGPSYRAYKY